MAQQKFTNNAVATLSASINSTATTITVASGQGALFPSLSAGDYFYATIIDSSNNIEIVKITARSTDSLTAVRAQESTTGRSFVGGDNISLRVTAAGLNNFAAQDKNNTFTGTNIFSGTNSFTGPAVAFTNVPTFGGGALPVASGGTGSTTATGTGSVVLNASPAISSPAISGPTFTGTIALGTNWSVVEAAGALFFKYGGVNKMKIDSSGNITVTGDVTAYGSV